VRRRAARDRQRGQADDKPGNDRDCGSRRPSRATGTLATHLLHRHSSSNPYEKLIRTVTWICWPGWTAMGELSVFAVKAELGPPVSVVMQEFGATVPAHWPRYVLTISTV